MSAVPLPSLEARIVTLERTLRRFRLLAAVLALALLTLATAAWRAGTTEVQASSLVLTDPLGNPVLTLQAEESVHGPGLVLVSPSGQVVMRLGGPVVRPVR